MESGSDDSPVFSGEESSDGSSSSPEDEPRATRASPKLVLGQCHAQAVNDRYGPGAQTAINARERARYGHGDSLNPPFAWPTPNPPPDPNAIYARVPCTQPYRNNLTALCKSANLYLAAYNSHIFVWRPRGVPLHLLDGKPDIQLCPRQSAVGRVLGGHVDGDYPNNINHLITGFLGDQEIVLTAHDDGDVTAYYISQIERAIGDDQKRLFEAPEPFFRKNVGKSAWGLAIHRKSKIIAVSSNLHEITVFAFALTQQESPEAWEYRHLKDSSLEKHVRQRVRNWRIVIPMACDNLPNISFMDNDYGYAWKLCGIDVKGRIWIVDLWQTGLKPYSLPPLLDRSMRSEEHPQEPSRGWGILALRDEDFMPVDTVEELIGVPESSPGRFSRAVPPEQQQVILIDEALRSIPDDPCLHDRQRLISSRLDAWGPTVGTGNDIVVDANLPAITIFALAQTENDVHDDEPAASDFSDNAAGEDLSDDAANFELLDTYIAQSQGQAVSLVKNIQQDLRYIQIQRDELGRQLGVLDQQFSEMKARYVTFAAQASSDDISLVEELNNQIQGLNGQVSGIPEQIRGLKRDIHDLDEYVQVAQSELQKVYKNTGLAEETQPHIAYMAHVVPKFQTSKHIINAVLAARALAEYPNLAGLIDPNIVEICAPPTAEIAKAKARAAKPYSIFAESAERTEIPRDNLAEDGFPGMQDLTYLPQTLEIRNFPSTVTKEVKWHRRSRVKGLQFPTIPCPERDIKACSRRYTFIRLHEKDIDLRSNWHKTQRRDSGTNDIAILAPDLLPFGKFLELEPQIASRFHATSRLNMSEHIPELNLLIVGSQTGRVAFITLTCLRNGHRPPAVGHPEWYPQGYWSKGFRVEAIVPRRSEEKLRKKRMWPLHGMAVGPVQSAPEPNANMEKLWREKPGLLKLWKLVLHFRNLDILTYEFTRDTHTGKICIF